MTVGISGEKATGKCYLCATAVHIHTIPGPIFVTFSTRVRLRTVTEGLTRYPQNRTA